MSDGLQMHTGAAANSPKSKTDLFVSFTLLALQGFGGVLAVVQRELVDKKQWLTNDEFVEDWAVAQILPGPNVVNLALMIGGRSFGIAGALAALSGLLLAPTLLVLLLAAAVAGVADTARAGGDAALAVGAGAVQRLGEDARHRRLADAARAGEQVGVVQALRGERVGQGLHHMVLPHHFCEIPGAVLAGEHEIRHERILRSRQGYNSG